MVADDLVMQGARHPFPLKTKTYHPSYFVTPIVAYDDLMMQGARASNAAMICHDIDLPSILQYKT